MTEQEKQDRIAELTKIIVFANSLGVRAEVLHSEAQKTKAAKIYREAKEELGRLRG